MKARYTISLVSALALAILVISTYSLAANASVSELDKPFGLTVNIGNVYMFKKLANNIYLLGIDKNGKNYVALVEINATIPPSVHILANISVPSKPCCIAVDDESNPLLIGIVYGETILIYDFASGKQIQFALRGKPLRIYPVGEKSFIVLTDKALIAVKYNENGWFEERILVGNLLENKREGRHIFDILPIYRNGLNYSYINVAEEAAAYDVRAQALLLWNNGTLIKNGQLIGLIREKSITTPFSQIVNGTATLLLLPGSYNLSLFLKQGSVCIKGPTIQVKAGANTLLRLGTIMFSNTSITACPEPLEARYLVLIGPGFPPKEIVLPDSSSQKLGDIKLLAAYILNKHLYIWITGANSKIFTRDKFVAVLVYDTDTLKPLTNLWRFYDGVEATQLIFSKDYKVVAFSSQNKIYIAIMKNNTYYLAWSLPLQDTVNSISITKYDNGYLMLSISKSSKIQLAFIKESHPPTILTLSSYNTPWISLRGAQIGYISTKPMLYVVISSPKGLTIITNMDKTIQRSIYIKNIYNYMVGYVGIIVYNPDGEIIKDYTVEANLTYHNVTLLSMKTTTSNGEARIPCISYGSVNALIIPLNRELYRTKLIHINCSNTEIKYDDINITLPYVHHKLILSIVDKYSNTPPLHNLEIVLIDIKRNITRRVIYPAKADSIVIKDLVPGKYLIRIIDPKGTLYEPKQVNISIMKDMFVKISISRKPVIVTIRLIPRLSKAAKNMQIPDKLNITVHVNRKTLFNYMVMAPSKAPIDISFTTLYRGAATIEIRDIPAPGYGKIFKDIRKTIYIGTESTSFLYNIILQQLEHPVTIHIVTPSNKPLRHILEVYPANSTTPLRTVNSTTTAYELFLPIGHYCFHVIPLAEYLGFKLYKPVTYCSKITGAENQVISIKVKRLRKLANITIIDPLSRGGVILDNITITLDGRTVASLPKGKPKTLTLPLLLNGSTISIDSEHDVYKPLKKNVKPQRKPLILKIIRTPFKYELTILSTHGKTLAGAVVTINGMDNILHLKYTANEKGMISITLPYGTYHICVSRPGYITKCYTLGIHASASDVITLKPTLATIIRGYIIPITIVVIGVLLVLVTRAYFKRVLERLSEEEF